MLLLGGLATLPNGITAALSSVTRHHEVLLNGLAKLPRGVTCFCSTGLWCCLTALRQPCPASQRHHVVSLNGLVTLPNGDAMPSSSIATTSCDCTQRNSNGGRIPEATCWLFPKNGIKTPTMTMTMTEWVVFVSFFCVLIIQGRVGFCVHSLNDFGICVEGGAILCRCHKH